MVTCSGSSKCNGAFDGPFDDVGRRERHPRADGEARFDAGVLQHALHHLAETTGFGFEKLPVSLDPIAAVDDAVRKIFGRRANHSDRCAQLVRDAGDEFHLLACKAMGTARGRRQQRDADGQEEEHAEADRQVLPPGARDRRLERAALVLHEQPPASEVLVGVHAPARCERFFAAQTRAVIRAVDRRQPGTRRASEEKCLAPDTEE